MRNFKSNQELTTKINELQNTFNNPQTSYFSWWSITKRLNPYNPQQGKQNLIDCVLHNNNNSNTSWNKICEVINPEDSLLSKQNFINYFENLCNLS